jgi:hypothetical protein
VKKVFFCLFVRLFVFGATAPQWARVSSFTSFLDHTQRNTTVGRTSLGEWLARCKDLYLTTQHSQQTDIYASDGFRTHNLSMRSAVDLRLRPRGHWDRQTDFRARWNLSQGVTFRITQFGPWKLGHTSQTITSRRSQTQNSFQITRALELCSVLGICKAP